MLKLILTLLLSFSSVVFAGELSQIDQVVRQTVIKAYSQDWEGQKYKMTYNDIWDIEVLNEADPSCLTIVTGLAKKPSRYGKSTYQFWVCLTRDANGVYQGELLDDVQVADE